MPPGLRRFLVHALLALLPAALLFLWTCDFASRWDGRAVSVRPVQGEALTRAVLIAEPDRAIERQWPAALVQELSLPVDALALAPDPVPPERPATHKRRFTLQYEVNTPTGWRTIATTSPQALGLALLVWLGLLAVRNMAIGGTPWSIEAHDRYAVPVQDRAGQPAATGPRRAASKPGPPPPRPVRGRGRR